MNTADALKAALKESLSPQAIAIMAAHLDCVTGTDEAVSEVYWFRRQLTDLVGGAEAMNALFEEVGL
jgi:hypothetical protein